MCFDVSFQSACSCRRKPALCALVWLLPNVGEYMLFQVSSLTKWLLAKDTSVNLFFAVGKHVPFQVCSLTKWLLATDTSVNLFFPMGDRMHLQSSCSAKWLLVFWTNVHLHRKQTSYLSALVDIDLGHWAVSTVAFVKLRHLNIFFDKTETFIWLITFCHFYFLNIELEKCWTFFWEWSDASTILENGTNKKQTNKWEIYLCSNILHRNNYILENGDKEANNLIGIHSYETTAGNLSNFAAELE